MSSNSAALPAPGIGFLAAPEAPPARTPEPSLSFVSACLAALAIEAVVVVTAGLLLGHVGEQTAAAEQPIELVFTDPPPTPKEQPKPPEPKPIAKPVPIKQAPPPPAPVAPPTPAPVVADSPVAVPQTPPPPPAPAHVDKAAEKEAEFAAKVKAAIQASVVYPPAARNMGYRGKARVEFVFRDGIPRDIRVIQGSGLAMIDKAAMAAVADAHFPAAPDTLKGKDVPYQVTVSFELNGTR